MIMDFKVKKVVKHSSDDGFFAELVKYGEDTFHEIRQTSYSETLPGSIKAFHLHKEYWEMWTALKGEIMVVAYDGREDSSTFGNIEVVYTGESDLKVIAMPPGVAHGYKVLSKTNAGVLYHAGKEYDPKNPGIEEIDHNDPTINFDWTKEHEATS